MANTSFTTLIASPFRIVELQTRKASLKLVDADEAEILEALVEESKPYLSPLPQEQDSLIATPFRYPPLRYGSRFGQRHERGIWYGSEDLRTAFCESSYYKFRFFEDSPDLRLIGSLVFDWTSFQVSLKSDKGVDLCLPPYARLRKQLSSPTSYRHSQPLGSALRGEGAEAIRFFSARRADGRNVAVFDAAVLSNPVNRSHWLCRWEKDVISIRPYDRERHPQIFINPAESNLI